MADKPTLEKLRILLPHWIEHNHSHREDFARWAAAAREAGQPEIAGLIDQAIDAMRQTDEALETALDRLGGPAGGGRHHHHHHD